MVFAAAVGVFAAPVIAIVLIVHLVLSIKAGQMDKDDPLLCPIVRNSAHNSDARRSNLRKSEAII